MINGAEGINPADVIGTHDLSAVRRAGPPRPLPLENLISTVRRPRCFLDGVRARPGSLLQVAMGKVALATCQEDESEGEKGQ